MKSSLFKGLNRKAPGRRRAVEACEASTNRGPCVRRNPLPPHTSASEPPISSALLMSPTLRTAATLNESLSGEMVPPLAGQTDESEAVNSAPVLTKQSHFSESGQPWAQAL